MSKYEEIVAAHRIEKPAQYNFARDVIDRWAENPERVALHWLDAQHQQRLISFAQISERSRRACNMLAAAGVKRGDTVVITLGREVAWWELLTACLRMGAIASPGTTQLSAKDLQYRINACAAVAVVTDSKSAAKLGGLAEQCPSLIAQWVVGNDTSNGSETGDGLGAWRDYDAESAAASAEFETADTGSDEEALCYFTSGTTGYPKMVAHGHSYALGHVSTGRYWLDLSETDLHWNISDTGWAKAAWSSYFGPWQCGAALFVHHSDSFDPAEVLELLATYPITTMCGAPTVYRMLVQQRPSSLTYPSLRHCVGAGEPLNPEVIEQWRKATGVVIRDGFGQTETSLLCGNFYDMEPRYGSMGKPAPGVELAIVDDQGRELAAGEEGDVGVRVKPTPPLGLFLAYKGQPEKTASCFRGDWYLTGDRAKRDDDGYFWFVSRSDDVILSAGYRIGPFEVESALIEHEAVAESAVVSSPDVERGEIVKAFVVLCEGFQPSEALVKALQQHVKAVTAPYKYPRKIEFVESLPKTVSGKIRRIELREQEWASKNTKVN